MFFNFHTHSEESSIYNYRLGIDKKAPPRNIDFSVGIHPWDIEEVREEKVFNELKNILKKPNCVALGEVGIDKNCGTNLDLQKELLIKQIQIAEELQKKVLIIHCVKAYQEILSLKKQFPKSLKWVLHGFNGGKELIQQLLKNDFYFSVGHQLLNSKSKIVKNISYIPISRLFLETDDSDLKIEDLYLEASLKYGIELKELSHEIEKNRRQIFSK